MSTNDRPEPGSTKLRDTKLAGLVKAHRATLKDNPAGQKTFEAVVDRLKYHDRTIGAWCDRHAADAWKALAEGKLDAASVAAMHVFDLDARDAILQQIALMTDDGQRERVAAETAARVERAAELGREVI